MAVTHRPGKYPPEQRSAAFEEFAERWLVFTHPVKRAGTPALLIFQQFQRWCRQRFDEAYVIGRTEFYQQIGRRYGALGATRYSTHGLLAYRCLRLRRRPLSQNAIDSEKMAMDDLPELPSKLASKLASRLLPSGSERKPLVLRKESRSRLRQEAEDIRRLLERAEKKSAEAPAEASGQEKERNPGIF